MDGLAAFKGIPYDIDPRTKAQAGVIMDALQAGMPEQTAIQVSDKIHNLPDGERKRLDQQFNRAGHLTELHGINELEHALKDDPKFNTGTVFSNMPEIPLDVKTQFSTLLHDYYLQTNGNEKLATQLATNDIKASGWGVSSVNGGREWLKWAPDLRGHDVEQVRADMVAAVGDRTNDPKSVKLVPYRDTELTQGKKWNLIYTNKDGLPDALFGSNGRLRGYTPPSREDEQSAIEKKATEDAQARLAVQIQSNEKVKEQIRASQAMDEAGLPGFYFSNWFAFFAPGGTPRPVIAKLNADTNAALAYPPVKTRFEQLGLSTRIDALLSLIGPASQADPKKPYDDLMMRTTRESMRRFIETRPAIVRSELTCLGESRTPSVTACAGAVALNAGFDGCLDANARMSRCLGGGKQRWHLIARGDAFQFVAVNNGNCLDVWSVNPDDTARLHQAGCSEADSQLFSMRAGPEDTQLISRSSGRCLAVEQSTSETPAVVQQPCTADPRQQWRLRRSLFN
jgi:hypothetical protein